MKSQSDMSQLTPQTKFSFSRLTFWEFRLQILLGIASSEYEKNRKIRGSIVAFWSFSTLGFIAQLWKASWSTINRRHPANSSLLIQRAYNSLSLARSAAFSWLFPEDTAFPSVLLFVFCFPKHTFSTLLYFYWYFWTILATSIKGTLALVFILSIPAIGTSSLHVGVI